MQKLKYLTGYSDELLIKVNQLIAENKLGDFLLKKYPASHTVKTDSALYSYAMLLKNEFMPKSSPISKVIYDSKITTIDRVLGMHYYISKAHGANLKARNEIRIASVFKNAPAEFLRMIVVHELAHLKEKEHDKAFYRLCEYMEPNYHQIEFDMRLYLTYLDFSETLYG